MDNNGLIEIYNILSSLHKEFSTEEDNLLDVTKEHTYRIDELEQQIITCRKNEDIDFRVFSPRNISSDQSDKIKILENEKHSLEKERRDAEKQIGYYAEKSEKISRVLYILNSMNIKENRKDDSDSSIEINYNENDNIDLFFDNGKKNNKPFYFIDDIDDNSNEENTSENSIDNENLQIEDCLNQDVNNELQDKDSKDFICEVNDSGIHKVSESENCKNGIPIIDVDRISHKLKFVDKIFNNDRVRARLELKEAVNELDELSIKYKNDNDIKNE